MMVLAALLLAQAPVEDAEHRADRLRTEQLNREANRASRASGRGDHDRYDWRQTQEEYREAQADYARDLARWRRQVADCRAGDWDACDPR